MGRHFGDLAVIRGIVYYRLSPHELKPFATAFAHGIPNLGSRAVATMYTWLPMFVGGAVLYVTVESAYHTSKKKDARIYDKEVPKDSICALKDVKKPVEVPKESACPSRD